SFLRYSQVGKVMWFGCVAGQAALDYHEIRPALLSHFMLVTAVLPTALLALHAHELPDPGTSVLWPHHEGVYADQIPRLDLPVLLGGFVGQTIANRSSGFVH